MNSQFCPLLPVGARNASSMHFNTPASSTGSGRTRRNARWVIIAASRGMSRRASASAVVGTTPLGSAEFGVSVMFADPSCGEALNFPDPFGEFARDKAFDPAADQRDIELHNSIQCQLRGVSRW